MSYVEPKEEAWLSSKEKALKRLRGGNFDPIDTNNGTHVNIIKLQTEFGDLKPIREAGPSSKEFFPSLEVKILILFS